MKKIYKLKLNNILRIVAGLLLVLSPFILIFVDKKIDYSALCRVDVNYSNKVLALIMIPVVIAGIVIWHLLEKYCSSFMLLFEKIFGFLLVFICIGVLIIQIYISYRIYFITGWDVSVVVGLADKLTYKNEGFGNNLYLSQYPNNIMITYILSLLNKLSSFLGYESKRYFVYIVWSCIIVNLAGFVTVITVKKITKSSVSALVAIIFFVPLVALSPWIIIPYSDTYGILFPILTIFTYLKAVDNGKARFIYWFFTGFFSVLGFMIKPTCAIVLIAILIIEFWNILMKEKMEKIQGLYHIILILLAFMVCMGIKTEVMKITKCNLNEDIKMTYTHYLMMGLNQNNDGAYWGDDYGYSSNFANVKERQTGNLEEIKKRLQNLGAIGYGKFFIRKFLVNYNDGTFAWWKEGGFYPGENTQLPMTYEAQWLRSFYYADQYHNKYFILMEQAIWIVLNIFMAAILIPQKCKEYMENNENVILLSVLGIFMFVMLFEARARYLYCYAPVFIVCGSLGIYKVKTWFSLKMDKNNYIKS